MYMLLHVRNVFYILHVLHVKMYKIFRYKRIQRNKFLFRINLSLIMFACEDRSRVKFT